MKKIIWLILAWMTAIMICKAENLNFRTNMLMFNTYEVEGESKIFAIFTNNLTEKILFTQSPYDNPSYTTNYRKESFSWEKMDSQTQNLIKRSIYETYHAEDFATQMYFYIHTQMLIWKNLHPELSIVMGSEMKEDAGLLEMYNQKLKARVTEIPNWLKDYKIKGTLELPKEIDYKLESKECEIKPLEHTYEITCPSDATIIVKENFEDTMVQYTTEQEHFLEGTAPREWALKITKEEEIAEEEPPEEKNPSESENLPKKEEIKQENSSNTDIRKDPSKETTYYKLNNVPNTFDNNNYLLWIFSLLCFRYFKRQ